MADGGRDRKNGKAGPASHANCRHHPYCRRSRQSTHQVLANEDHATADKADARNNLGGDTRWIEDNSVLFENVCEAVFGNENDQSRGEADNRIGAQAGALLPEFALEAISADKMNARPNSES